MTAAPQDHLTLDSQNANRGTPRGRALLRQSLERLGAGRSALSDKHGVMVAGNKTLEAARELGIPIREVETSGDELIVVKRTDLDLSGQDGGKARELAYADNRIGQLDLEWDIDQLLADHESGVSLDWLWGEAELSSLIQALSPPGDFNPQEAWEGMPDFEQDAAAPIKQVIISFLSEEDIALFAKLIGQPVTMATKGLTFNRIPVDFATQAYVEETPGAA